MTSPSPAKEADPQFATELERELYRALLMTASALTVVVDKHAINSSSAVVRFTGEHERFGVVTIHQVLDLADNAIDSAKRNALAARAAGKED